MTSARIERNKVRLNLSGGNSQLFSPEDALALSEALHILAYNAKGEAAPSVHIERRQEAERCKKLDRKLRARSKNLGTARRSSHALYAVLLSAATEDTELYWKLLKVARGAMKDFTWYPGKDIS